MIPLFLLVSLFFLNLYFLRTSIEAGYFDHPFWTRSMRSALLAPPFAIIYMMMYFITIWSFDLLKWSFCSIAMIMKKRV